jgi:hypothetical protein
MNKSVHFYHYLLLHYTDDDSNKLREVVESLKVRYDLVDKQCADSVVGLETTLPVAEAFRDSHDKLVACLQNIDTELKTLDPVTANVEDQLEVGEHRIIMYMY